MYPYICTPVHCELRDKLMSDANVLYFLVRIEVRSVEAEVIKRSLLNVFVCLFLSINFVRRRTSIGIICKTCEFTYAKVDGVQKRGKNTQPQPKRIRNNISMRNYCDI